MTPDDVLFWFVLPPMIVVLWAMCGLALLGIWKIVKGLRSV